MDSPTDEMYNNRANLVEAEMGAQVFKPLATPPSHPEEMLQPRRGRQCRQVLLAPSGSKIVWVSVQQWSYICLEKKNRLLSKV